MRRGFVIVMSISFLFVLSGLATAAPAWKFDDPGDIAKWGAFNQCNISVGNGALKTESTGADPYFFPGGDWNNADWEPFSGAANPTIFMRMKVNRVGVWQVYYTTVENASWGEEQRQNFDVQAAANFTDIVFNMDRGGWQEHTVNHFRIDPGTEAGIIAEIDYISLNSPVTPVHKMGKLAIQWGALKQ